MPNRKSHDNSGVPGRNLEQQNERQKGNDSRMEQRESSGQMRQDRQQNTGAGQSQMEDQGRGRNLQGGGNPQQPRNQRDQREQLEEGYNQTASRGDEDREENRSERERER